MSDEYIKEVQDFFKSFDRIKKELKKLKSNPPDEKPRGVTYQQIIDAALKLNMKKDPKDPATQKSRKDTLLQI